MRSIHQSDMPSTVRFLFSWIDSSLSIHSMGGVSDERHICLMSGSGEAPIVLHPTSEGYHPEFSLLLA